MNIIIAGDGKVGSMLTRQLSTEGHNITVIDSNAKVLEATIERYDVIAVHGNCASMDVLMELATVLGLLQQDVEEKVEIEPEIQALIDERQAARKAKNYARADEIRDQLAAQGITLKDTPQGVQVIRN